MCQKQTSYIAEKQRVFAVSDGPINDTLLLRSKSGARSSDLEPLLFYVVGPGLALAEFFGGRGSSAMTDNSRRTSAAIEAHYNF